MAGIGLKLKIEGEEKLAKKLEPEKLMGGPVKNMLEMAALVVERKAKEKASGRPGPNVVTGRLRSSITHKLDTSAIPLFAKVGTPVFYGKFLELGTSKMPPYPFLKPALEESKDKVNNLLKEAAKGIEENYRK